jgi:hypothetical protein
MPHRPTRPQTARHHQSGRKHDERPDVETDRAAQPRRTPDPDPDQPHRSFPPRTWPTGSPPTGGRRNTSNTPANTWLWTGWTATPTSRTTLTGPCPTRHKTRALTQVAAAHGDVGGAGVCAAIEEARVQARQPGSDGKATAYPAAATALSAAEDDLATAKAASRATTATD